MIECIILLLIVREIFLLVMTLRSVIFFSSKKPILEKNLLLDRDLHIIVPVYMETETICISIDRIRKLISGRRNLFFHIVGTIRERVCGENPTLQRAISHIGDSSSVNIMECPFEVGGKASQLNYAVSKINLNERKKWVLILDIDSIVSEDGLNCFISHINKGDKILQQHSVFLSNICSTDLISWGHALYQSHWTLSHEMARIFLSNFGLWVCHVVGHGLCINVKLLEKYGGFPESVPIEDVALGYYFSVSRERVISLNTIEIGDNPITAKESFDQVYRWSFGPMKYKDYYNNIKTHARSYNALRAKIFAVQGCSGYVRWILTSPIVLFLFFTAFSESYISIMWLVLRISQFYISSAFFFLKKFISLRRMIISPFLMILFNAWCSAPVILSLINNVIGRHSNERKSIHR